jgi:RNA polymerase subunit RPABC4/transcription elongation factor Spt4
MEDKKLDPGHNKLRDFFRVTGPLVALAGLIFVAVGLVSFFSSFGSFEPPRHFWCAFVGVPLLAVGMLLCKLGYMGKVIRYVAGEVAPVGKDTINYMVEGTKDSVKTMAQAIGEGLGAAGSPSAEAKVRCHKCNDLVEEDAKFCDQCGTTLGKTKACPGCKELNDPDAKFCDDCGHRFG